jgi:acetyl-CoA carboxylase carboxyl transferase subunit alpha
MAAAVRDALRRHLGELQQLPVETLLEQRYQRYRRLGLYQEPGA